MSDAQPRPGDAEAVSGDHDVTEAETPRPADAADEPVDASTDAPADAATDESDEESADESVGDDHLDLIALAASDPRSREELVVELLEAEARRDEYLDDLRRARAEFDNYRRRVMREGAAQRESGRAEVVEPLLEVLDDLDRTLAAAEDSPDPNLSKGVELVASKLVHALRAVGLERLEATEVSFDPTQHEAVQQQPAEEPRPEPMVVQVLRPGYRLGDRVLRAAMVVVEQ